MKIITWSGEGFITELKNETQIDVDAECIKFDKYLELLKGSSATSVGLTIVNTLHLLKCKQDLKICR